MGRRSGSTRSRLDSRDALGRLDQHDCVHAIHRGLLLHGRCCSAPQNLDPKGAALVETLSNMYVGPFGQWARVLFLIGAGAVLFKTLYLSCAANSRLTADFLN